MEQKEPDSLPILFATLRAEHGALDRRVGTLEAGIEAKHRENRRSIHELRNSLQTILDSLHQLDLKFARSAGYAVGAGAVVGIVVELISHLWK